MCRKAHQTPQIQYLSGLRRLLGPVNMKNGTSGLPSRLVWTLILSLQALGLCRDQFHPNLG